MARAIWKGAISFGLVHIPVSLVSATTSSGIDFDWLDERSMDPVGYKRINKTTGKEVALGLDFSTPAMGPEFAEGVFVGEHGSWNRKEPAGYKVVFVPFSNGEPAGDPVDFVFNFYGEDGKTRGRPVGVTVDPAGALIVADDLSNTVWRVTPER